MSLQVEELKAKYGKNQKKLNSELQALYQKNGIGIYYFVFGLFGAFEQFIVNLMKARNAKTASIVQVL